MPNNFLVIDLTFWFQNICLWFVPILIYKEFKNKNLYIIISSLLFLFTYRDIKVYLTEKFLEINLMEDTNNYIFITSLIMFLLPLIIYYWRVVNKND